MTDRHDIFTFLNKKKLPKNSHKIFTVFQKTVDDGLNPPPAPLSQRCLSLVAYSGFREGPE